MTTVMSLGITPHLQGANDAALRRAPILTFERRARSSISSGAEPSVPTSSVRVQATGIRVPFPYPLRVLGANGLIENHARCVAR